MNSSLEGLKEKIRMILEENNMLKRNLRDCRNELCLRCGNYKEAHKGACNSSRRREAGEQNVSN